jgi:hypothetical protein
VLQDVFFCYSRADREMAGLIAKRLELMTEARILLEECPSAAGQTVAEAWEAGLSSSAIVLLLTPHSVPQRLVIDEWRGLLEHAESMAGPAVFTILAGKCRYPRLLERRHFYRWNDRSPEPLRELARWLLDRGRDDVPPSFVPAVQPWFEGRHLELETASTTLVDRSGILSLVNTEPGSGKTSLAQEFARTAASHFRDVIWLEAGELSSAAISGRLAWMLGIREGGPAEQMRVRIEEIFRQYRLLIVFDDLAVPLPFLAPPDGRTSMLITTRNSELQLPGHARILRIERVMPPAHQPLTEEVDERLWLAMSVCRRSGFPLSLAARIASLEESEARAGAERLAEQRWIDQFDATRGRYRLSAARSVAGLEAVRGRHAEVLNQVLAGWWKHPELCEEMIAEVDAAYKWALETDWNLAAALAERSFAFFKASGRLQEAAEILERLGSAARVRQDGRVVEFCAWELSWIKDDQGEMRRISAEGAQLSFDFFPTAGKRESGRSESA